MASTADGIRRGTVPPPAVKGDAYNREDLPALPGSLEAAILAFDSDELLKQALGAVFSDYFITSRRWELKAWRETVTDWELQRYEHAI